MASDEPRSRPDLLEHDRSRSQAVEEGKVERVNERRQEDHEPEQAKRHGQARVARKDGEDESPDKQRNHDEDRQRESDQEEAETDDGAHRRDPRSPRDAQPEGPVGVVLGGAPHQRALAHGGEDEERDRQEEEHCEGEHQEADVLAQPGRHLLQGVREVRRVPTLADRLVWRAVVEAGAAAFARKRREQP